VFKHVYKQQSIWNKEELPEELKESIIVPIHKKGDKTDCNNYRGISLLPTTYKNLSNILLSRMDLQEVGGSCGDWMELAQDGDRWRALVGTVRNLRVPKMWEFLD
jgi:hypothetical protein